MVSSAIGTPVIADGVRTWCTLAEPPIHLLDDGTNLNHVWVGPGGEADVVIFDLRMRAEGSPEFEEFGKLIAVGCRVVVFSGEANLRVVLRCAKMGAMACITKAEGKDHFAPAIGEAAVNKKYTAPAHGGVMVADRSPERPALTKREIDVLRAWCAGASI